MQISQYDATRGWPFHCDIERQCICALIVHIDALYRSRGPGIRYKCMNVAGGQGYGNPLQQSLNISCDERQNVKVCTFLDNATGQKPLWLEG